MADLFAEFAIPDTDVTRRAYELAFAEETPAIANHSVRTYLFGRALGESRSLRPGADYDDELLFLACILHDYGLTEAGDGDQRFEVDGADAAAAFLEGRGVPAGRVRVVWEAIALHSSVGIADRMRPETALTSAGAAADVIAQGAQDVPAPVAARAHAAFPRLEEDCGMTEALTSQIARNPAKAPMGTLPYEIARQVDAGVPVPRWTDLIAQAWPGVA